MYKMVKMQQIVALLVMVICATEGTEQQVQEGQTAGCLALTEAGMEAYDMFISIQGLAAMESANAQLPIDLDLTDRGAVEDFLCGLSSVSSFSELAEFTGMPESFLREMISRTMAGMSGAYGLEGEGEDLIREFRRNIYILMDAIDFAEQVGFNPDPLSQGMGENDVSSSSSSEEAEEQLVIDVDQAYSFIVFMSAQHGKDFASDLINLIRQSMGGPDDVNVDRFDLLTAIVESQSAADFASTTDLRLEAVVSLFGVIGLMQNEMYEGAAYTMKEYTMAHVRVLDVLLDLGFFSWE